MKSAIVLLLVLAFLAAGCGPSRPQPATNGERIVSLAPNLTEIICAIGAGSKLAGRTSACDYPPDIVKSVPVIGGFGAPSMDRLLKTRPTLILDVALEDESVARLMAQLGIRRVRIPCATLADIPPAILEVGRLAHAEPAARELAERIRRGVAARRRAVEEQKAAGQPLPAVFAEIWGDPLMTVGRNSFVSDIIALAGGRNVGDEVADKDYFSVSGEWVMARNPDIILCFYMIEGGGEANKQMPNSPEASKHLSALRRIERPTPNAEGRKSEGQAMNDKRSRPLGESGTGDGKSAISNQQSEIRNRVAARTGWAEIKAVRDGRVYGGFDNNLILRPGPRVLEGIAALQACIQPSEGGTHDIAREPRERDAKSD